VSAPADSPRRKNGNPVAEDFSLRS